MKLINQNYIQHNYNLQCMILS